jgi:hypothetical protein
VREPGLLTAAPALLILLPLFTEVPGRCILRSSHRVSEGGIMILWWKGMTHFS